MFLRFICLLCILYRNDVWCLDTVAAPNIGTSGVSGVRIRIKLSCMIIDPQPSETTIGPGPG